MASLSLPAHLRPGAAGVGRRPATVSQLTGVTPGEPGSTSLGAATAAPPTEPRPAAMATPSTLAAARSERRPVGALGDFTADAADAANPALLDPRFALNGASRVIGRAVMAPADDFITQPTRDAGARRRCGVSGDRR